MKYYFKILLSFIIVFLLLYEIPVKADLPLQGKIIVVDAGHGGYLYTRCNKTSEKAL